MTDYATLLRDHITLTCRSIDRIFLQAYVPKLQSVGQVCLFLNRQRGFKIPSSAAFGQIGEAYVAAIHRASASRRAESSGTGCTSPSSGLSSRSVGTSSATTTP